MSKVLVTGANGFVGTRILEILSLEHYETLAAVRKKESLNKVGDIEAFEVGSIDASTDWSSCLKDVDVVVHVAARAYVMGEQGMDALDIYRQVNLHGTLALGHEALRQGVKRFIYISSIKAMGEKSSLDKPLSLETELHPEDAYGLSKLEAEMALKELTSNSSMELTIIRPPLVYGKGVKGNFASLAKLSSLGFPIPLGCMENKRSLVAIDNLVDLIKVCIDHPKAGDQTFLVSDDDDVSTSRLLRELAHAQNVKSRLFCMPVLIITTIAKIFNKRSTIDRLYGSLQVDITDTKRILGWQPIVSLRSGIENMFKEDIR